MPDPLIGQAENRTGKKTEVMTTETNTTLKSETIEAMKEARRGKLSSFATVDDLMADLNADD